MTSQAILGDSPMVVGKLESNVSKGDGIRKSDNRSFERVMEHSSVDKKVNMKRLDGMSDRVDKAIMDKRAEIAQGMKKHILYSNEYSNNNQGVNENTAPVKPFLKDEFITDIKDVINDIADAYKDVLDVEDEELISIMETLGINLFQLPLEDVIKDIVLEAKGESDITALLVNEDALNSLNKLKDFFSNYNIEGELDMSVEEFSNLVNEAIDNLKANMENLENVTDSVDDSLITVPEIQDDMLNSEEVLDDMKQDDMEAVIDGPELNRENLTNMMSSEMAAGTESSLTDGQNTKQEHIHLNHNINKQINMQGEDNILTLQGDIKVSEDKTISVEITKTNDTHITDSTNLGDTPTEQKLLDGLKDVNNSNINQATQVTERYESTPVTEDITTTLGTEEIVDNTNEYVDDNQDTLDIETDNLNDVDAYTSKIIKESSMDSNSSMGDSSNMSKDDSYEPTNLMSESISEAGDNEAAKAFYDKFIANLENSLGVGEGDIVQEMSHIKEMREVVAQLVDKIKVNINKDNTTMKMMLAPEHLGKLELEVTSKSGVMTAKFVVESVTAKEAIESGLQILVDKFKEQGVVVEAVEVSIANYDMHKEHGRDKGSKDDYEIDIKKKRRHGKITLEDMDAVETEETEIKENKDVKGSMTATTIDYAV